MWRISVRVSRTSEWVGIWAGAGPEVERDARAQFTRVCARLDGVRTARENLYSEHWLGAQLVGPDGIRMEHMRAPRESELKLTVRPGDDG
jgi:hypothetical protein